MTNRLVDYLAYGIIVLNVVLRSLSWGLEPTWLNLGSMLAFYFISVALAWVTLGRIVRVKNGKSADSQESDRSAQ